jgi:hypothetical protein
LMFLPNSWIHFCPNQPIHSVAGKGKEPR